MAEQFAFSGFSASNMLACVVDGTDIYQTDYMGNRQLIGKTMSAYNELEQTTTQYYDKLVELGVIVPPKSQEELMGEMQKTMADMAGIIQALSTEVKELKSRESGQCNCSCKEDVSRPKSKRSGSGGAGSDKRDAE